MNLSVINDQFSMKWYLKCFRQYSDFKGRAQDQSIGCLRYLIS